MRKLLILLGFIVGCLHAHGAACNLSAGTNNIQAAVTAASTNSCTGTSAANVVQLAAGTYTMTSKVTIPCNSTKVIITGPTVAYPGFPTAILNGSISDVGFGLNSCTNGFQLSYVEWNGGRPSGGGGGMLFANAGVSNVLISYVYAHGFQTAVQDGGGPGNSFVYFTGSYYSQSPQTDSNIEIAWNRVGSTAGNDCSNLMNVFQYIADNSAGDNYGSIGGYCGSIGLQTYTTNLKVHNNNFFHVEQGMKFYEGNGNSPYQSYLNNNSLIQYNDFNQIHRIAIEAQQQAHSTMLFDSNSFHDWYYPGFGSWALSLPQSGGSTAAGTVPGDGLTNDTNNVILANAPIINVPATQANCGTTSCYSGASTGGYYYPGCVEFWGNGISNTNLCQGYWGADNTWGYWTNNPRTSRVDNNIAQLFSPANVNGYTYITPEECGNPNDSGYATCIANGFPENSGNKFGTSVSSRQSTGPTISISGTTVTITSNGDTSGVGPQGNTSAYYTTDGSTPTTSSTFCGYSCSFTASSGATINAIGMWGALNQPKSYATNFGFTPSVTVSAKVSGTTPTLTSVALTLTGSVTSITAGTSVQAIATCTYSDASTQNCTSTATNWTSSNTAIASVTTSGSVAGLAAGTTNLTVKNGSVTSPNFALTVTAATKPTLQGVNVTCPNVAIGQTAQCSATCQYSGQITTNCTTSDQYSNVAGSWTSATTSVATINSASGVVTGVAAGSSNITAAIGTVTATPFVETVTSNAPPAATLTAVSAACSPNSVAAGSTVSCTATCTYSDMTTTNCTTADAHGTTASSWTSSNTGAATINSTSGVATGVAAGNTNIGVSAGSFTSPSFSLIVVNAPQSQVLGDSIYDVTGSTSPNYINATYAKTGNFTSTVQSCSFYIPAGHAAGALWDCGIVLAPTPSTQASSWLCEATYTTAGTTADAGWHQLGLQGCGTLAANTGYWISVDTNESGNPPQGFWDCGGSCTGSAPTVGNGTYPCAYVSQPYGTYTGMTTTMNTGGCGAGAVQSSQYVTLTTPTPTLTGGYLTTPGSVNTLQVGTNISFFAACGYSNGQYYLCSPNADAYGNTLTSITSNNPSVLSITSAGVATAHAVGSAVISATVTGGIGTSSYGVTVTVNITPLPPVNARGLLR